MDIEYKPNISKQLVLNIWANQNFRTTCFKEKLIYLRINLAWKPASLRKLTLLHGCFSRFLNCTNGTKSHNVPHL